MVIQLQENQHGKISLNGDLSEPFTITNGVKQGCFMTQALFSIFLSTMLKQATDDLDNEDGVYVRYRLDDNLFNLRRLRAHTNTQERLLFTEDAASSPTQIDPCCASHLALWTQSGCLAMKSASRRLRFYTSLCPRRTLNTPHHHWRCRFDINATVHFPRLRHII